MQSILTGLVKQAQKFGALVMLSTLRCNLVEVLVVPPRCVVFTLFREPPLSVCSVHGEMTTGNQTYDANTTLYTQLIQQVANTTKVPVTTLHWVRSHSPCVLTCRYHRFLVLLSA